MTPATVLASVPDDVLRAGDGLNERQRQAIRLARYFEQRGHRPTWAEIEAERARRTFKTNERTTHRRVIRRSTTPNEEHTKMTDSSSEELDAFQHTHAADGHQLQTAGFLDAAEPACPDCGLHIGGLKLAYQHKRSCPAYSPHPNSIAAQADRHN